MTRCGAACRTVRGAAALARPSHNVTAPTHACAFVCFWNYVSTSWTSRRIDLHRCLAFLITAYLPHTSSLACPPPLCVSSLEASPIGAHDCCFHRISTAAHAAREAERQLSAHQNAIAAKQHSSMYSSKHEQDAECVRPPPLPAHPLSAAALPAVTTRTANSWPTTTNICWHASQG